MSIFGDMFEDGGDRQASRQKSDACSNFIDKIPPPPRCSSGLTGIYNQGATCYLNALLQTLLMTPEFRESLFLLNERELGDIEDIENSASKVRVIPIELQKLFANILLSNQQGSSTIKLTDSFGWTNSEELQQHDVQELNRILFSAIEDSLVGTTGQNLIKDLYHGSIVNQTICDSCGRVSERDEDFFDLCLMVAGTPSLEESMQRSYVEMEQLSGKNQYRCDNCKKLVNARKGARLRHLPSILTFSLLRFSFDFVKLERYKESGKFTFPTTVDMKQYLENHEIGEDTEYELFSVVIHRGSTHGGHYHAYIRDVDGLGKWTHPDEEEIQILTDPSTGKVDFIEFDSPVELIQAILAKSPTGGLPVDNLCGELVKETGVSWNNRFKKLHGPIKKFLKRYDDKFDVHPASGVVRNKSYCKPSSTKKDVKTDSAEIKENDITNNHRPLHGPPSPGYGWYDFDDSRVRPITEQELEKQFSGKESAYMLFYRKTSMRRPEEAYGDPTFGIPSKYVSKVLEENIKLDKERDDYDKMINSIELEVHFGTCYQYFAGALKPNPETNPMTVINFDRRKTTGELRTMVSEFGGVLLPDIEVNIHHAKELPSGLHVYSCLTDDLQSKVMDTPLANRSKIFVWDGKQVNGSSIPVGEDMEPVLLTITHGSSNSFSHGFPRSLFVGELRTLISNASGIPMANLGISRVITKGADSVLIQLQNEDDQKTLGNIEVVDGDHFIAENTSLTGTAIAESTIARHSLLMSLLVENRCDGPRENWPVFVIDVNKTVSVGSLKNTIQSQMNLKVINGGGRLRIDDDDTGLSTPLFEDQDINTAGLKQGMRVVIEPGTPPLSTEITLSVTHAGDTVWKDMELTIAKTTSVLDCLQVILRQAGLEGDEWHLRKTNWCGEEAEVLDRLESTLMSNNVQNGNQLILCIGKMPPHGFIQFPLYLLNTPATPTVDGGDESMLTWITSSLQGLLRGDADAVPVGSETPVYLGELLISTEATLEEMQLQIMKLPKMVDLPMISPKCMRLRMLENKSPTTVLRGHTNKIGRLKLNSASAVGVQILPQEEDLNPNQLLLGVRLRVAGTRSFMPPSELVWDMNTAGATSQSLRIAIGEALKIPTDKVFMAKHFPDKFEWMVIKNNPVKGNKGKKCKNKVNLRHAPYRIRDGDSIGVKDLTFDYDSREDMSTEEDDLGRLKLEQEAEDKRKKREEARAQSDLLRLGANNGDKKRREVGIKIHVGNFR